MAKCIYLIKFCRLVIVVLSSGMGVYHQFSIHYVCMCAKGYVAIVPQEAQQRQQAHQTHMFLDV